jgi:type IV secretory pathway VirB2 component (pilin)
MDLSGLTGVVGLAALVITIIDFLRNATAGKAGLNAVVTQVCAWIAGLVAVFLYAESQLGDGITIGDTTLDHADTATKIIIGLGIASIASTFVKLTKSIDNTDSNKQPPLVG